MCNFWREIGETHVEKRAFLSHSRDPIRYANERTNERANEDEDEDEDEEGTTVEDSPEVGGGGE